MVCILGFDLVSDCIDRNIAGFQIDLFHWDFSVLPLTDMTIRLTGTQNCTIESDY